MGWLLQYRVESPRKKCEWFDKWLGFNNKSRNFCAFMTRFSATWKSFFSASFFAHRTLHIFRCCRQSPATSRVDRMPFFSTLFCYIFISIIQSFSIQFSPQTRSGLADEKIFWLNLMCRLNEFEIFSECQRGIDKMSWKISRKSYSSLWLFSNL